MGTQRAKRHFSNGLATLAIPLVPKLRLGTHLGALVPQTLFTMSTLNGVTDPGYNFLISRASLLCSPRSGAAE